MKTPRFEELAKRWAGKARVYFIFSEEAHPRAAAKDKLVGFAAKVQSLDANKDGQVTLAEFGDTAPRFMFDAFDLDHDGVIKDHEFLAARRIEQFADVDDAKTYDERVALAKRFRAEVPGTIPILIDEMGNPTAKAYGENPNSAFVIDKGRKVALSLDWAAANDVDRELAKLTSEAPKLAAAESADLAMIAEPLAAARKANERVLVEMSAPGCDACVRTDRTLADPEVDKALSQLVVVKLGIEHDRAWRLFEQLDLAATPAFVLMESDGRVVARAQGYQGKDQLLAFLHQP